MNLLNYDFAMIHFKELLRVLMIFYQFAMLVMFICFYFIKVPFWLTCSNLFLSFVGLVAVLVFNKAINILPDEN